MLHTKENTYYTLFLRYDRWVDEPLHCFFFQDCFRNINGMNTAEIYAWITIYILMWIHDSFSVYTWIYFPSGWSHCGSSSLSKYLRTLRPFLNIYIMILNPLAESNVTFHHKLHESESILIGVVVHCLFSGCIQYPRLKIMLYEKLYNHPSSNKRRHGIFPNLMSMIVLYMHINAVEHASSEQLHAESGIKYAIIPIQTSAKAEWKTSWATTTIGRTFRYKKWTIATCTNTLHPNYVLNICKMYAQCTQLPTSMYYSWLRRRWGM